MILNIINLMHFKLQYKVTGSKEGEGCPPWTPLLPFLFPEI